MNNQLPRWIGASIILGAMLGLLCNTQVDSGAMDRSTVLWLAGRGEWLGKIFLSLLSMVVVPLVFSSVFAAITSVAGQRSAASLGARTVGWYLSSSALAIATGLLLVNLVQPGQGVAYAELLAAATEEVETIGKSVPNVTPPDSAGSLVGELILRSIPTNVIDAASSNRALLSLLVFTVLFALAAIRVGGEPLAQLQRLLDAVQQVMLELTSGVLWLAPVGIFGYLFAVTASTGLALVGALSSYLVTVLAGLFVHGLIVLPLIYRLLTGSSPLAYARACSGALTTAFSTASSAGTLPVTMEQVVSAGVPREVASFTLPLGATVNMDGTALYEVVAVLFIAQMLGDPTLAEQGIIAVTALLVSVGAAGIPHAGLVMMVVILEAVGLPTEATLVLLAVDRVADMARTAINVWSDAVGAAVVAAYTVKG